MKSLNRTLLSVDIETVSTTKDSEDALNPFKNAITVIGVYNPVTKTATTYRDLQQFNKDIWQDPSLEFVGHNFKFDFKTIAAKLGPIDVSRYAHDTRIMAFISTDKIRPEFLAEYDIQRKRLNAELPPGVNHREARQHSLKTLAPYFLDVPAFWEDPTNHDSDEYVTKDVIYTWELYEVFSHKLESSGHYKFYVERMMPWARMILSAEMRGIYFDTAEVESLLKELQLKCQRQERELKEVWKEHFERYAELRLDEISSRYDDMRRRAYDQRPNSDREVIDARYERLEKVALEKADTSLNLNSPEQLKWLLRDQLKLDVTTIAGKESTDKEVLQRLSNTNPEVKLLLDYREANKLVTAFLPKYLELAHNSRIYTNFNIDGTRTGRLSSSSPNMQQHPRELKHLFKATPGKKLITYDLTAIEPLVMAYITGDDALCDVVLSGKSIHSVNAITMFGLECDESEVKTKYPEFRQIAKVLGLACLYGAGWRQVQMTALRNGISFTESQSKSIVRNLRETYKDVWAFKQELDLALEKGATIYNLLGRPIKIHNPEDVFMKGLNTLVQGTASDLCLEVGRRISEIPHCTPVLFIHDSVVTEVDADVPGVDLKEIDAKIKHAFTDWNFKAANGKILQIKVEGGISDVWE